MLLSTHHIMWPMALGSLKWLHQTVKEMHLKENTFLDLGIKVTLNIAPHPLHHVTYSPAKFLSCDVQRFRKKIYYLTSDADLRIKVTWNVVQYSLHHVTYAAAKFEAATSNGFGGDAFKWKYCIWPWPWGEGHTRCCPVPSTSCDLFRYKVWSYYV